ATSILDYIFRELAVSYLGRHDLAHVKPEGDEDVGVGTDEGDYRTTEEVKGGAARKLDEHAEHAHLHTHETQEAVEEFLTTDDAGVIDALSEIRASVLAEAGGNPVGDLV